MNVAFQRNIGAWLTAVPALAATTITAGSGQDGAPVDGLTFDRFALEPLCLSAFAVVQVNATLAADQSVEVNIGVQDSADGVTWADYDPGPSDNYEPAVLNLSGQAVATRKLQLGGARRYVRIRPTFTLSASGSDTAAVSGVLVVGGADELPYRYVETPVSS